MDEYSQYLAQVEGNDNEAAKTQQACQQTLLARNVPEWVFANDEYSAAASKKGGKKKTEKA
jgi:hypothetical protein